MTSDLTDLDLDHRYSSLSATYNSDRLVVSDVTIWKPRQPVRNHLSARGPMRDYHAYTHLQLSCREVCGHRGKMVASFHTLMFHALHFRLLYI